MSDKLLLLYSAKERLFGNAPGRVWRIAATIIGVLVVLYGASDLSSRLAHTAFGSNASLYAFAPAVALINPNTGIATTSAGGIISADATSTATTGIIPAKLLIPSIGVNATVEQVGKKDDGAMGTPSGFGNVGWYSPGALPGAAGNAVIDGHVNNALTTAGVFQHLSQIALGDTVTVVNASGAQVSFIVTSVQEYSADSAPSASIFATSGPLLPATAAGCLVPRALTSV